MEFYFAGMRVTDCLLLKWTDFQSGRLHYQMSKNGQHGSVKVPPKQKPFLTNTARCGDKVNNPHNLIFLPLRELPTLDDRFELRRKINHAVNRLNNTMEKILPVIGSTKNASQHKARHSFAQRDEEKEIHPKVMYRHEVYLQR